MASSADWPWIVFAGGGTGGHLFPALAVADALRKFVSDISITFLVTDRAFDSQVLAARREDFSPQPARPFSIRPAGLWRFLRGWRGSFATAGRSFHRRRPRMVIGSGGYAAGPPVRAAQKQGIPTALLNPDAVPGRANRYLARHADHVFAQWECPRHMFGGRVAVHVTGCPVRPGFGSRTREQGIGAFGLAADRRTLLVTGASQGARSINQTMLEILNSHNEVRSTLTGDWQVLHLSGTAMEGELTRAYQRAGVPGRVLAFTEQMPEAMAASDLIVSRAGASTLGEITAAGRASVLMPYPYHRDQHQRSNARVLEEGGAAILLDDDGDGRSNARRLVPVLERLAGDLPAVERMADAARELGRPDAAASVAKIIKEVSDL